MLDLCDGRFSAFDHAADQDRKKHGRKRGGSQRQCRKERRFRQRASPQHDLFLRYRLTVIVSEEQLQRLRFPAGGIGVPDRQRHVPHVRAYAGRGTPIGKCIIAYGQAEQVQNAGCIRGARCHMAAVRSSPQGKHRARDRYPAVINDFELFVLRSFFVQKIAVLLLCAIPRQRALTRFIAVAVSL